MPQQYNNEDFKSLEFSVVEQCRDHYYEAGACVMYYPRVIPRMAARCTTPAAAMHHFGGMGAPFQQWLCTIICGQVALFERRTQLGTMNTLTL